MAIILMAAISCDNSTTTKEQNATSADIDKNIITENTSYEWNGESYEATLAYNPSLEGKRPGILVLPEWWGLNDYSRGRAKDLAKLGYVALALDVYGNGKQGNNPDEAQKLASVYYNDPALSKEIIDAGMEKLKSYPQVDTSEIAAIGYCFGGFLVLNAARLGADLKGVVSIHGGLTGVKTEPGKVKAKVLVLHGADDEFENSNVAGFKKEMDDAGVDSNFIEYPNATHAFSNPNATAKGKEFGMPIAYNEAADKKSWEDMKEFFKKLF